MSARIAIEGELTVFTVHALKDRLMSAMADQDGIELHLDAVSEVDGAGIQLLVAARREALHRGHPFTLVQPSAVVAEALALSDLTGWFQRAAPASPTQHTPQEAEA